MDRDVLRKQPRPNTLRNAFYMKVKKEKNLKLLSPQARQFDRFPQECRTALAAIGDSRDEQVSLNRPPLKC